MVIWSRGKTGTQLLYKGTLKHKDVDKYSSGRSGDTRRNLSTRRLFPNYSEKRADAACAKRWTAFEFLQERLAAGVHLEARKDGANCKLNLDEGLLFSGTG